MTSFPAIALTPDAQGRPTCLSTDVARHFQKKHNHVLRDIERIRSQVPKIFFESNFGQSFREVTTGNGTDRKFPVYHLTRDAFSLLVMGMTGRAAVMWKLRYIEAFNALEAAVAEDQTSLAREAGYRQGLDEGRAAALPEVRAAEEARQKTARLIWTLGPKDKRRLRAAVRYRKMGLGTGSIARLLDIGKREAFHLLRAAEALGELPEQPARPVQGSLLTDGVASGSELIAKAARSSRLCRVNMDATPEREKEVNA